jgi:hypothetical protein
MTIPRDWREVAIHRCQVCDGLCARPEKEHVCVECRVGHVALPQGGWRATWFRPPHPDPR